MAVRKVESLADFKRRINTRNLKVHEAKSGSKYALADNDELVAWVADDCNFKESMVVFTMVGEDGDTWCFIANGEAKEREALATI